MDKIPENIKLIAVSVGPLMVTLLLSILVGNFGISKVREVRAEIQKAQVGQNVLSQKVALLQTISVSLQNFSSSAAIALPDSNTSLAVISQLKGLAASNALTIGNIKVGVETKDASGLSRADTTFDLQGSHAQIIAFLGAVTNLAPIMIPDKVKIIESGGLAKGSVTIKSFWAALPKSLPAVDQAISDLSSDEKATLTKVESLTPPSFSALTPSSGGRADPFSQ